MNSGDFAFVMTRDAGTFRKVLFNGTDKLHLTPLNPKYPEDTVPKSEIRQMWKLVRQFGNVWARQI